MQPFPAAAAAVAAAAAAAPGAAAAAAAAPAAPEGPKLLLAAASLDNVVRIFSFEVILNPKP